MEFWGVEVKPGVPFKFDESSDKYVHLSQAALGEVKKDKASEAVLYVTVDKKKLAIGTLAPEKCPQLSFDLVFDQEFEFSHTGKSSVYLCGYKTLPPIDPEDDFTDSDDSEDEEPPMPLALNGKPDAKVIETKTPSDKANAAKPEPSKAKAKQAQPAKVEIPKREEGKDEDDDEDDESEEDESASDEDMAEADGDSDEDEDEDDGEDEDESSEDEKEVTPKKVEAGKKRAPESATKTPVPEKKAKLVTPTGTKGGDAKKGGHAATPHPSKNAGKTSANSDKSKPQTPKSAGQVSCKSCNKTFNSDNALQAHTKAKHAAAGK